MSLIAHLQGGATTTCLCWAVERVDGQVMGFTDHDRDLSFDGVVFRAGTGMTARVLEQTTGLSVDNSEAAGALSDAAVTEADLRAGRYDGAALRCWRVNWAAPEERALRFSGHMGEVTHDAGGFRAELRGLSEAMNRPIGRVIHAGCDAILGDARCGFDLARPGYSGRFAVARVEGAAVLEFDTAGGFEAGWFERGICRVLDGAAAGLRGWVKSDRILQGRRVVEMWQDFGAEVLAGDSVELVAGCDKRAVTCREKFDNFLNFRGFPDVPTEDWLTAPPSGRRG